MCLTSTTDHSLKLGAGAGVVEPQIEILGTGTRGVTIKTPTIIDSNLTVNGFICHFRCFMNANYLNLNNFNDSFIKR